MFSIGEFSKIAQVSISQIRYYDEIGLFKPQRIDQITGYRYYSATQLTRLNKILTLKELGLSLDQISRMVNEDISSEEIRGMFMLRKAQAENIVQDELVRLRQIDARLQQIENGASPDAFDIVIKPIPEMKFFSLREKCPSFNAASLIMQEMYRALPNKIGEKNLGHFMFIMHSEDYIPDEEVDLEMGFLLKNKSANKLNLSDGRSMSTRTLPAVETMATAIRVGFPTTAHPCRAALALWIETNEYEFDGIGREKFIVPPFPGREHESTMEIQYPIKRINSPPLISS